MGRSKRLRSGTQQELLRPLEESDKILAALVRMATRIGKPFSEARMQQLHDDLAGFSVDSIEWALDTHGRNSKVLPSLADLLKLLSTWQYDNADDRDRSRDGTGYNGGDIVWLFKRIAAIREKYDRIPTSEEYIAIYKELNATRKGGTPQHYRGLPENWMVDTSFP
jgi:hypothetical protein